MTVRVMLFWHPDVVSVTCCCILSMITLDQHFQVYESTGLVLSVRSRESPMYAALVLSQSVRLYQLKCGCASTVCFTQCRRRCQMVILSNALSATLLLPCYYRVMRIDIYLLSERSISSSPNLLLVSEMEVYHSSYNLLSLRSY